MSKEDVKNLLLNGSLDSLLDCLDFAPSGVIDLVKELAISLPVNDSTKRQAIFEKTGLNIDQALLRKKEAEEEKNSTTATKERRVKVDNTTQARRTTPDYKIVSK